MDRKGLIQLYLNAETTCQQERELAASVATVPPVGEEERAVYMMMQAVRPIELPDLPEADDEFDRMVGPSKVRPFFTWGLPLTGVAAAIAAVVLFTHKPEDHGMPDIPQNNYIEIIKQIAFLTNFNPAEAENLEFKPVGDGFVMTAHFPDGQTASYILTPLDGGESFNLVSLNQ